MPLPAPHSSAMRFRVAFVCLAALIGLIGTPACIPPSRVLEISRERAIEIARAKISFQPDHVEAVKTVSANRPVWRVTFRGRLPGQPPLLFETILVDVDRQRGEIVSISRT